MIAKPQPLASLKPFPLFAILGLAFPLVAAACASSRPSSVASGRPECVSLSSHSGVIQQVTNMRPQWNQLPWDTHGDRYQWIVEDTTGTHTLTVATTPEGCVCATNAKSEFHGSRSQGETAGLLQGAAVAPVSELDYTSRWLEPRILLRCPLAFLFRSTYTSEAEMGDGTTWRLSCTGSGQLGEVQLATTLAVLTPECIDAFD